MNPDPRATVIAAAVRGRLTTAAATSFGPRASSVFCMVRRSYVPSVLRWRDQALYQRVVLDKRLAVGQLWVHLAVGSHYMGNLYLLRITPWYDAWDGPLPLAHVTLYNLKQMA